jgi:predicted SnoaL-like aldol condensation-catalyzing enzyme
MKAKGTGIVLVLLLSSSGFAQSRRQLEANKKVVLDFFRVVFQAENIDATKDYLAEGYIQHNPNVPTGREGFINFFKPILTHAKPVQATLDEPPVIVMAEGNLVTVIWKEMRPEPSDKSKKYESFSFDTFRVKDGKLVEHWDGDVKK